MTPAPLPAPPRRVRLAAPMVERLDRALAGNAEVEEKILRFISHHYGARSLLYIPVEVAMGILARRSDFCRAVNEWCRRNPPQVAADGSRRCLPGPENAPTAVGGYTLSPGLGSLSEYQA